MADMNAARQAAQAAKDTAKAKIAAAKREAAEKKALRLNPPPKYVTMPEPTGDAARHGVRAARPKPPPLGTSHEPHDTNSGKTVRGCPNPASFRGPPLGRHAVRARTAWLWDGSGYVQIDA